MVQALSLLFASHPAFVPAGTHDVEAELWSGDDLPHGWFSWRKLWRFTGPGFLMSIGYIVSWGPATRIG